MFEKFVHIHDKPFWIRALARLPLVGFMLLLAVAFPFFGAFNAVLGAFTTSFGTYIIPCVGYNLAFKSTDGMVKQPPVSLRLMKGFNWAVAIFVIGGGVGFGGYQVSRILLHRLIIFTTLQNVTSAIRFSSYSCSHKYSLCILLTKKLLYRNDRLYK